MKLPALIFVIFIVVESALSQDVCETLRNNANGQIEPKCLDQLDITCKNPQLFFQLFDASSKYPNSGLLYSNNQDFGNFDECMQINFEQGKIIGKYCPFSLAIVNFGLPSIPKPFDRNIDRDQNHFYKAFLPEIHHNHTKAAANPSVSTSILATCIPDACKNSEVGIYLGVTKQPIINQLVHFIDSTQCTTILTNTDWPWGDILFICFLVLVLVLIIVSTSYDTMLYYTDRKPAQPVYLAFSILTNGRKLLHITRDSPNPETIPCLNGLRFISMMWVICGHGFVSYQSLPIVNYKEIQAIYDNPFIMYAAAGPIAVDTFFFLSGLLLAFSYMKTQPRHSPVKQLMGVPIMVVHRYLRLTPALAVLYFFTITIFRKMGNGPLWLLASGPLKTVCTDSNWWTFFLYVQNYANYDSMCLNHTWYLSADMQMFMLAPLVLIPTAYMVGKHQTKRALIWLGVFTCILVVVPMIPRFVDWKIENTYDTHSRLNDYLFGIMFGVFLRQYKHKPFMFTKIQNFCIWIAVFAIDFGFIAIYHNVVRDNAEFKMTREHEHTKDTLFYGLYRPIWSMSLIWMVYSCYKGYGGVINWFLTRPIFQVGARLSYCMYLLHAVIEIYWAGIQRSPLYFSHFAIFYAWCGHFMTTMFFSLFWSLAFESPMITVEKFIFGGAKNPRPVKKANESGTNNEVV